MKLHTLNSIYEIDEENSQIRRLQGDHAPTARISEDGEWRTYVSISTPTPGVPLVITWPDGQPELRDHTVTSTVLGVENPWLSPSAETLTISDSAS